MKKVQFLYVIIFVIVAGISGCNRENTELKKEAQAIAKAMCQSIETMNKLTAADPADTLLVRKLQSESNAIGEEMASMHDAFNKKFGKQSEDPGFKKEFSKYLREAMLECPHLSKEERENFSKETP
jgi:hypothetical protein